MVKKMTNKDMINAVNRILAMQDREAKANARLFKDRIKVSYAVKKNKDKLEQLLKPYNDSRKELLDECNKKEANLNGTVDIKMDCLERWNKEMGTLLDIEIDAEIHMIKFSDIEGLELAVNDIEAIDFMLETPEGFGK